MVTIKDFEVGSEVSTPLLNGGVSKKLTRTGKEYLEILGKDKTGSIDIKVWNPDPDSYEELVNAKVIYVSGLVDKFNETLQFNAKFVREAEENEYALGDLLQIEPGYDNSIVSHFEMLLSTILDEDLFAIANKLFKEHKDKYNLDPAAIGHHHSKLGGMAVHIKEVTDGALALLDVYKHLVSAQDYTIIRDYIIAGSILHDIGKFYEYQRDSLGYYNGFSREGALTGHLAYGFHMIMTTGSELGIDPVTTMNLAHIALSHHEKQEWGSTVSPAHRAAAIIAKADQLSASLNPFFNDFNNQETEISEKRNIFGNRTVK